MKLLFACISILFCFSIVSCNTTEPPSNTALTLKFEDVSCNEAWLKLTTTNLQLPATINLYKNNAISHIYNLNTQDSLLYIDSLLPNRTYKLKVSSIQNPLSSISSNELSVTTMDTTSHNFTWQTFEFGQHNSSVLYDVAMIDENNIWAVGKIYMNDSLGHTDTQAYGVAIWNGQSWELKRLFYDTNIPVTPRGILVINPNEIYLASGSIFRWNGISSTVQLVYSRLSLPDPNATIEKLWGSSGSLIYGVGNAGSIVSYNGQNWQRIESSTDIRLTDIYGSLDDDHIWVCGWDNNHSGGIILEINNFSTNVIWDGISNNGEYYGFMNTLWTNGGEFWLAGGFVFRHSLLFQDVGHLVRIPTINGSKLFDPGNFVLRIRGTKRNNIFLAGDLGMLWHYNGTSWNKYDELYNQQFDRRLNSIDVKNNLVVSVGWKNSNAWIVLGEQ